MIKWFDQLIPDFKSCVLTLGNFDGLHLGHQRVLQELTAQAAKLGLPPVIISYFEHPGHFIYVRRPVPILTPRVMNRTLFSSAGFDNLYFLNFNAETAHVGAMGFLQDVIVRFFKPRAIVAGHDSNFGYEREGNAEFLIRHENEYGYSVVQVESVVVDNEIVSSTLIRDRLTCGEIASANRLLGKPYALYGTVTYGQKIGRTIGFPTVNMSLLDSEQLVPANGVYLSRIKLSQNSYFGLTNIGISPTLKHSGQIEIETHVLDYNGDVYNENLRIDLLEFIRKEEKYATTQKLRSAIYEDIRVGRELIKKYESHETNQ